MTQLTTEQLAAVESISPRVAVFGCPGSGKTEVIIKRCAKMHERDPLGWITVFTLTRASAEDVAKRIETSRVTAITFHAFANVIFCEYAERLGWGRVPTVLSDDEFDVLLRDVRTSGGWDKKPRFVSLENARWAANGKLYKVASAQFDDAQKLARELHNRLRVSSRITYDLMVMMAISLLEDEEIKYSVAKRVGSIVIDEAQDADHLLWKFINKIGPLPIFAVGDPRQAIFGFRGGDCEAFEEFAKTAERHNLTRNHRSTLQICRFASKLFPSMPAMESDYKVPNSFFVDARPIARDDYNKPVTAIIARTNAALDQMETDLKAQNIEYARLGEGMKPTDDDLAAIAWARAMINPHDEISCLQFYNWAFDVDTIEAIKRDIASKAEPPNAHIPKDPPFSDSCELYKRLRVAMYSQGTGAVGEILLELARHIDEKPQVPDSPIILSTAHRAKGLEFDHVVVLGDSFRETEADRKILFVAITRAKHSALVVGQFAPKMAKDLLL